MRSDRHAPARRQACARTASGKPRHTCPPRTRLRARPRTHPARFAAPVPFVDDSTTATLDIAVNGSDVYVGGSFTNAGTTVVRGIAKWDGANWSGLGSGVLGTSAADVRALAFGGDGKLYCCGRFTNISGVASRIGWRSCWSHLR